MDVLLFADDMVLIADSARVLINKFEEVRLDVDKIENENELGEYRNDEGGKRERTLLCGSWRHKVGVGGGSEVFGADDKWGW